MQCSLNVRMLCYLNVRMLCSLNVRMLFILRAFLGQIFQLCSNLVSVDIKNLHLRETWNVDTDDERGGTTLLVGLGIMSAFTMDKISKNGMLYDQVEITRKLIP